MEIPKKIIPFLKNEKFDSSLEVNYLFKNDDDGIFSKIGLFQKICKNKTVIHVGCVDHSVERMISKITKKEWLHSFLVEDTKFTIGIDTNAKGIKYIKDKYKYEVIEGDIKDKNALLQDTTFDYILFPDVIEHVEDPILYLKHIKKQYANNVDKIFITVPNALSKQNFKNAKDNIEKINSDHIHVFTHYTLSKVLTLAGFEVESIYMMDDIIDKKNYNIKNYFYKKSLFIKKYLFRDYNLTQNRIGIIAKF